MMTSEEVREAIEEAKAREARRLQRLYDAEDALREVRTFYSGIGSRSTNKIVVRAQRALDAIHVIIEEMGA